MKKLNRSDVYIQPAGEPYHKNAFIIIVPPDELDNTKPVAKPDMLIDWSSIKLTDLELDAINEHYQSWVVEHPGQYYWIYTLLDDNSLDEPRDIEWERCPACGEDFDVEEGLCTVCGYDEN